MAEQLQQEEKEVFRDLRREEHRVIKKRRGHYSCYHLIKLVELVEVERDQAVQGPLLFSSLTQSHSYHWCGHHLMQLESVAML